MDDETLYEGREQTLVKHYILEQYLERFAHIVGSAWDAITYVDCFSGPWNARSNSLDDSSFAIAVSQLRKARHNLDEFRRGRGKPTLSLRCLFLEKEKEAYRRLTEYTRSIADIEIKTLNQPLERAIDEIITFAIGRADAFPFFFVDPTGWTGFAVETITPLLALRPGEVLVNFMTGHIARFAEHPSPSNAKGFDRMFGRLNIRERIADLTGPDREDELVRSYCEVLKTVGKFDHVCPAVVLRPEKDRTHFHLIYGTRNPKGVEVFKDVEKRAMSLMESARAGAQQRDRQRGGQLELLGAEELHNPQYYTGLRNRYLERSRKEVERILKSRPSVLYDEVWGTALAQPLVWESDLKLWLRDWSKEKRVELVGLKPSDRVPKRGANHHIRWTGPRPPLPLE